MKFAREGSITPFYKPQENAGGTLTRVDEALMDETAVSRGGTFLLGHDDVSTPKFLVLRERTTESDASRLHRFTRRPRLARSSRRGDVMNR